MVVMKERAWLGALALWLSIIAVPASAVEEYYRIDVEHSNVLFFVSHLGFADTVGRFAAFEGRIRWDRTNPSNSEVAVTLAADSLTTFHAKRDQHLKSSDFFSVNDYPQIQFVSTALRPTVEGQAELEGELTLLGVTRPITLAVTFNREGLHTFNKRDHIAGFSAVGQVKRSEFGMDFGLVDGVGVGDEVELRLEIEAVREPIKPVP